MVEAKLRGGKRQSSNAYVPERGDVVWINFNPSVGREQGRRRPALVLSSRYYNGRVGLALVCPITSHRKGYPFEIEVRCQEVSGVILADHVRSVDWTLRRTVYIDAVPVGTLREVRERIVGLLTET